MCVCRREERLVSFGMRISVMCHYSITAPYIKGLYGRTHTHAHTHTEGASIHNTQYTIFTHSHTCARKHTRGDAYSRVLTAGQGDRHIGKGHTEPAGHLFSRPVANRERVP